MNIGIIGAGSWGTAMAIHLVRRGHIVTLVTRDVEAGMKIASMRENPDYLKGIKLEASLQVGHELKPALMKVDLLFLACPSHALRSLGNSIQKELKLLDPNPNLVWITLCKGLEKTTFKTPTQVLNDILEDYHYGVLSGPNNAEEIAQGKPAASVLAGTWNKTVAKRLQSEISDDRLRLYLSDDLMGVELGGCLKNIYAIGMGICDGIKLGDNAKAAYITRSLSELIRLGTYFGGKQETFYGLSGFGDLIATSYGTWSRNRTLGQHIGEGFRISEILNRGVVVEGYWATKNFYDWAKTRGIEAPILSEIYAILYESKPIRSAIAHLMNRELKEETE